MWRGVPFVFVHSHMWRRGVVRERLALDAKEKEDKCRNRSKLTKQSQEMIDTLKKRAFVEIFETLVATVAFHKERVRREMNREKGVTNSTEEEDNEDLMYSIPMFATSVLSQVEYVFMFVSKRYC